MKTAEEIAKLIINSTTHSLKNTVPYEALFAVCIDYIKEFESYIRKDQVNKCVDAVKECQRFYCSMTSTHVERIEVIQEIQNTIKEDNDKNGDQTSRTGND